MGEKHGKARSGGFFAEMEGNRRLVLSGCGGIHTYTEDCIRLRTGVGVIAVYGRQLEMGCMTVEGATVTGYLQRIEWEE